MKKLLYLLQNFFKDFIVFLIALIWLQYLVRTLWVSLLVALTITIIFDFASRQILTKKTNKNNLKFQEKEDAENMFLSLATCGNALNFLYDFAKTQFPSVTKKSKYILINNAEKFTTIIYPLLQFAPLTKDDVAKILCSCKADKIIILCGEYQSDCLTFIKNFDCNAIILDKDETYSHLYKAYDFYPPISMRYKKDKKLSFKQLLSFSFNPTRTKGYLMSAVAIFLSSFLVRASIYYCIVASILFVAALVSYSGILTNEFKENVL